MNPLLSLLQPYPFERLRQLHAGITPNPAYKPISLGIGEPRHATPQLIKDALTASLAGLASYPGTLGEPKLRQAMSDWLARRYGGLKVDVATHTAALRLLARQPHGRRDAAQRVEEAV